MGTREEQIQEAAMTWLASKYGLTPDQVFESGAKWADEHPVNKEELETLKMLFLKLYFSGFGGIKNTADLELIRKIFPAEMSSGFEEA